MVDQCRKGNGMLVLIWVAFDGERDDGGCSPDFWRGDEATGVCAC